MDTEPPADDGSLVEGKEGSDREASATRRYLDLLRDALLDEHYLENELRIAHLLECIRTGREVDREKLANPARHMTAALQRLSHEREGGVQEDDGAGVALAYANLGRVQLDHLRTCLEAIHEDAVPGDLVDVGTGRGGAAIFMNGFLEALQSSGRRVWVLDRFDGSGVGSSPFAPELNTVRQAFARFELLDDRVRFVQGEPSRTVREVSGEIALLRLGTDDPNEIRAVCEELYERVAPGGFVLIDRYGSDGCRDAVDALRSELGVTEPLQRVGSGSAVWRKAPALAADGSTRSSSNEAPADLAASKATADLAVIVVVHDMHREAQRTLHSLSRSYQRGIDDLDYEVIVVENGSRTEECLGEQLVRSFGPEFRYLDLAERATPSPAAAINRGIACSDASTLALMIDGAHVLTPGVLRFGMLALSSYDKAIALVKQWYLGPGQQPQMIAGGYDKDYEDGLLRQIGWPSDGYRLFEIGHMISERDWFDGDWESNCIFASSGLLEQNGAMDESFTAPGGGYVNLDLFERLVGTPGVTLVTLLGEGSFHQVHGGTTTNNTEPAELIRSYAEEYERLRGRRFSVPAPNTHYVGALPPGARRTRPRRLTNFELFRRAHVEAADTRPSRPVSVPQDLRDGFIDAFWRSGEWHHATWLGRSTHRPPTDLFAYQEVVSRLRPDWVVETRTGTGGRALFLASICDLLDHGQVLSIDAYGVGDPPEHPRITYLRGDPAAEHTAAQAREIVGERPNALVILGGGSAPQISEAYGHYAPFVPVGSYLIIEDTILQGNPVWSDFGSGPAAAAQQIVDDGEFVRDHTLERYSLTFNVGGFLKRVRQSN